MSAQSAKKKRIGSRRRVANQNEISKADEFHVGDSTSVAESHIPEEHTESLNVLGHFDNSQSESQHPPSPELSGGRRKLGSSRRLKGRHVKDSVTESYHEAREEVEDKTREKETTVSKQTPLAIQPERQEALSQGSEHDDMSATPEYSSEIQKTTTTNYPEADLESLIPKGRNLPTDLDENENDSEVVSDSCKLAETTQEGNDISILHSEKVKESAHPVGISELTSLSALSCPTVDQQLIDQSNFKEMPEEKLPSVCSVTEKEGKERDDDTESFRHDGNLQGSYLVSESHVESVVMQFSTTPEITTEKISPKENTEVECSVGQATILSPKEELPTDEEQNEHFNLSEVRGAHHSEDDVNKQHEQEIRLTEKHMPHDDTENSEIISGNLTDQTEVSDTYQSELTEKSTDGSPTNQDISYPEDKRDEHLTDENNFEALEQKNEDYHVYDTTEPQISDIERVDSALGQVYEIEGRVEDDIKPGAEQTAHQEKEGLFSEVEESESSLLTVQSEINATLDSQPQQDDTSFNPIGNRRKLGSSRRNRGRRHVKDSAAESDHEHKEDAESTSGNEAIETAQMLLATERTSQEELSQGSEHDVIPETHDSSLYSATVTDYSSEVQSPTTTNYPEADLESLIPESENLQKDHDERETHFKVEVSDKSVGATLEGSDKSDSLQGQEVKDQHPSEDAVNKEHEHEVKPTENQEMPQIDKSSESVIRDATENSEIISGNLTDQTEVSDTYQSELTEKSTDGSPTNQDISYPEDKQDEHPTDENNFEALEQKNEDYHVYDTKEPQISDIERVDSALGQVYEIEGRVEDDIKPSAEQTAHQEKEGLFSKVEERESSLLTVQSEINATLDSQPQQDDISFNPIGNRRKLGSSRRNRGRRHVKDSAAESDHEHKEDVESTRGNEAIETAQMLLATERTSQEQLSQGTEHDVIPETHDISLYSATMTDYSSEVQSPTTTNYPEADLESLIPESENLQEDHDDRETHFKVEVSDKPVGATLEGSDKSDSLQGQEVKGQHHSEDAVNKEHEQEVKPTENQEMPQIDNSSESVIRDEVSDTYQSELTEKSTDGSPTNQDISYPEDKQDEHPTDENNFEALEQKNEDYHVYDTKEPQISDIERVDTAPGQVYEIEGRVEDDIKPGAEQTAHQEKEGLFSEVEESESSLQTMQSEINATLDSRPQQDDTSFNPIGNRRKLGSSRRNRGRQHVKDSAAESDHEHKEDVESTRGNEAIETAQILATERTSQEELSQGSEHDVIPETHDSSLYSATVTDYSSEVQSPTTTNYPEADLESLIPESENLQEDHDERETHFKVEVSDKSVGATLEGADKSDSLQGQEVKGEHHSEDAVNKEHEHKVKPTENQEMPQIHNSSENVMHDATENSEIISGNLTDQTEVSDTYQSELAEKSTDGSPTNQDISYPDDKQDEHPTKEVLYEIEGRVEDDIKPSAEQTAHPEKEGLFSEVEESGSSLLTVQSEINAPLDSQPQQDDTSFNPIGNRRKLGSSRRHRGRRHVKDSAAESDHEPTEDVVGNTRDNEPLEITEMSLTIETAVQEKSMETMLEGMDTFDTPQTEDVSDQVKENAYVGTVVGIDLHSSTTVDQQMIDQSNFRDIPDEELLNVSSVTEKENKERDEDTELFRQVGHLQTNYLVSEDIESSITPEITTEQHSSREHTQPEYSVEQAIFSSPEEELPTNEEQNEIFNLPEQEVKPTENQEMPQIDNSSESVMHDATENSELISGNLTDQTEVSDTCQSELTEKNTDGSPTNQDISCPEDKQDEHPTKEVVYEIEGRVEDDIKPSAEQTAHQEKEGLFSEVEESESSLLTVQSEINASLDSQPQQDDTSFNPIGNRRKLGSSRRNRGRQHVKDSAAESDHEHKEDVESTRGNEAIETAQILLATERMSQEELSQGSEHDVIPETHDSSLYSATMTDYSSEVQSPTTTNYPEADLESLIPKSENLQEDHDDRETHFKVEVSDKSVGATLEGSDKSDSLQSQEVKGQHHSEDAVNKEHEQEVKPTENQEMPQIDKSQPQQDDTSFNPIGNRRKLGSSRRHRGRRHVMDSAAESDHEPTEDVVGNTRDNEPLEITEMSLTMETAVQEKSMETMLEGMDTFDTPQTEDVSDQVKHVGTQERDEDTESVRRDENLQTNYLVSETQAKSEDIESSISPEVSSENSSPGEHTEIECSVEQAAFSSSKEELSTNEERTEHVSLGARPSEDAVNKVHEEAIKPIQMQEMPQIDNSSIKDSELTLQTMQSEHFDPQHLDNSQSIKEQTHTGFSPKGHRRKLGSSRRQKGRLHVEDTTKMSLPMETMRQEELKEQTDLDFKFAGEIRSTVNNEGNTEKMLEEDTIVATDMTSSSGKDDFVKSNEEVNEEECKLIKETENLSQLRCDTVKMDLIQSLDVSATAVNMQQTNDTPENVGDVTKQDYETEAESSMHVQVYGLDEDGEQFEDTTKKDHEAHEMNVSPEITHAERFSAPHDKTDTLAPFDVGLEENIQAEPAVAVSEESGISSQQGIQEQANLDDGENLQGGSKQKRRKLGSTRRTQLNRKPEEKTVETKDLNADADMRSLDKMEVVEELTMTVTAEGSQNENAKPSQSPEDKEQQETISKAFFPEQSASHNEEVVNPVKFVHIADVRDNERNVEPSQIDDFTATEMHISDLLSANTEDSTGTGITDRGFVSSWGTTQSTRGDEERPESVNITQDQSLKSAEVPVVADFEIVKAAVRGGAAEEHTNAQASKQEPDDADEGAHNKHLEMKNASPNLDSTNRKRKMGSSRRNLVSRTKREDLNQKQEVDDEATETETNVGDVKTVSFSGNVEDEPQLHTEHKDSEQREESETVAYSHTDEENPVSHGQLVETEHQLTPSYLPSTPSTSPKHDSMSESSPGGRRRKMGSHRKSHGHQNNENQTAGGDRKTDNERDVRSITDESAIKTTEEPNERPLGLDKISEVDQSDKKPSSNISTAKSEKTPEPGTPVQRPYAEIVLGQESQHKFSLGDSRGADLRANAFNVMMVGDSSVGKSSFMKRAQSGKFSLEIPASIGLDSCMWTVLVDGKPVVLQLWDTAGQERFHSITRQIFHKAHAFLLMYDITSSQSFSAVSYWANCIQEGASENVTILLAGNKCDHAERQVNTEKAEALAKEYNFEFMECSAATGENVVHCLETVARMLSQKIDTREEDLVLHKEPQQRKSGCC
ncbi:uncharacterized protein rab44 isoform X2 [Sebastes umbrosus]|uniref:uncharacterized protein rab44 isoform X2 n=1 Tax=Sebastes umbrosus TaxID=72105 RepID=UPI0018A08B93|nr:uncharacterized protein rab44 isoform X2 [Sebastes umbrosus]